MTARTSDVSVLTWNLFHGRDHPPEPGLHTLRSRLLGTTVLGERYAQVNRSLAREFATVLARERWDVALLQEAPPRWARALARACGAAPVVALTSRNALAPLRSAIAARNPDLIASNEGGSNQLLVRPPWRIAAVRRHRLARRPERRTVVWARLEAPGSPPLCVANLHASAHDPAQAAREVEGAAERAVEWAAGAALVLGGDLNVRPARLPGAFERLERRFSLAAPTAPGALDHLLARPPAEVVEAPRRLPDGWRELPGPAGRLLRLSDHPAVLGRFRPAR
jgi:endonuclease/exonuclease/phosphatase family metal-dependent hydrolase